MAAAEKAGTPPRRREDAFWPGGSRRALSLVVKGGGLATRALVMGLHAFAVRGLDTRPVSGPCQLPEVRVALWPALSGRDLRRAGAVGAEFDGLLLWCTG